MNTIRHATFGVAALCIAVLSPPAQAAEDEGWDWVVAPYLWAADISTDLQLRNPPPPATGAVSTDTRFVDIIDKIDGAFQIHIEGQGDHWGMFTDFTYLSLADHNDRPRFRTESDLDNVLFELAAVWSPDEHRYRGLDLFAGLRRIDVDLTVQLEPVNPLFNTHKIDPSETYNDFMLGARYTWAWSDRWGLTLRGDGSFGDTDGTWNAGAVANYKMKRGAWYFGYRYLSVEVENDAGHRVDITLNGPMIGYGFAF